MQSGECARKKSFQINAPYNLERAFTGERCFQILDFHFLDEKYAFVVPKVHFFMKVLT